ALGTVFAPGQHGARGDQAVQVAELGEHARRNLRGRLGAAVPLGSVHIPMLTGRGTRTKFDDTCAGVRAQPWSVAHEPEIEAADRANDGWRFNDAIETGE